MGTVGGKGLKEPNLSKSTKHSKLILWLNINLEGFIYNLLQKESKSAH